ncbi:MAG: DEAD/DEAH box helicase family protein [Bacteroidota bacterium]
MNRIANQIKNRLSLRPPQSDSLDILSILADKLELKKDADLTAELAKVKALYPTCTDFERNFPSMCFALATGVGKTRLMGAFVAYLYLEKGIKNFFVLAPNLTIYNKLIEDFENASSPKYVFQGIGEFVHSRPRIVTGDNYDQISQMAIFESEIHINVFNISKINSETRGGKLPRIKRLVEYLGESYFNYLSNLDDLVLLMDESHHYRAERGMDVINELNPILGLELTATPKVERGGNPINFKNVVYEYSLAKAIRDGFVKEPAVATRKDFDPTQYKAEELDRIKLEDGIRIHEDTKVALDIYSRDNKIRQVKPFVLVVAKDTDHAGKLMELIKSSSFFEGYYADKVMEIHSNQSGEEKDENIERLVSLENPDNKIEIVIHVNMLKEGWDVTNLYTIIPLRTAASTTLREQTIGRGLRLPYAIRTGVDKVDKLTIVAHDKFQQIIDEANKPDSIIKKENIIVIDTAELEQSKVVVTSVTQIEQKAQEEQKRIETIADPKQKQKAQTDLQAKNLIISILPELNVAAKSVSELTKKEVVEVAFKKIEDRITSDPQANMFAAEIIAEVKLQYEAAVSEFTTHIIEIPRITIQQSGEVKSGFKQFALDVKNLNYQPVSEEILIKKLREQENSTDTIIGKGRIIPDKLDNIIVNELINHPEVDYDRQADLLFALADQAIAKFKSYLKDGDELINVVQYHKKEISDYIYAQLMEHFYFDAPSFEEPIVKPFTRIEEHNYSKYTKDALIQYRETVTPTNTIPTKVFTGFLKASHTMYKFDSKTEKDFAIILEDNKEVLKWLRPAGNQFHIYWQHNSRQYHPDFVAETADTIYMVETKKEGDIESTEVQDKSRAAMEFCKHASDYTIKNHGKPWKYVLIPHGAVQVNMSFGHLVKQYEFKYS